jgi:hypothetical protein
MAFRLRVREINSIFKDQVAGVNTSSNGASEWHVECTTDAKSSRIKLTDPFRESNGFGPEPEKAIKWYFEQHIAEPFETTKADLAAEALSVYGRELAAQIVQSDLLPKNGDIDIEVTASSGSRSSGPSEALLPGARNDVQLLHWEVLEDPRVWPSSHNFKSVSVVRVAHQKSKNETACGSETRTERKTFKILLVASRQGKKLIWTINLSPGV